MSVRIAVVGLEEFASLMTAAAVAGLGGTATVGNTDAVPYARYVHDGTAPHEILPRNGKALYWPGAQHPVMRVNHPGYKGNPYLSDALDEAEPAVVEMLGAGVVASVEAGVPFSMALQAAGHLVETLAKARANVRTGKLRDDINSSVVTRY